MKKQTKFLKCAKQIASKHRAHGIEVVWDHEFGSSVAALANEKYGLNAVWAGDERAFREALSIYFHGDTSRA